MIGKNGGVKLMDFGIARDQAFGDLTETGTGLGTPRYMIPGADPRRQARLPLATCSRSASCCTRWLRAESRSSRTTTRRVMHKIRLEKYPSPRKLNPEIPRELERIIARCMQKRKEDRWQVDAGPGAGARALHRQARRDELSRAARAVSARQGHHHAGRGGRAAASGDRGRLQDAVAAGAARLGGDEAAGVGAGGDPGRDGAGGGVRARVADRCAAAGDGGAHRRRRSRPGFCKILVDPWAEVYIDGKYTDTTPFNKALSIPEGEHKIEFKNPFFNIEKRNVNIKRGVASTLKIELARK